MAKKNKILNEPVGIDSVNWAIVCHQKPHQLAFRINEACGWQLKRLRNLMSDIENPSKGFALYNFQYDPMHPDYYLISLKEDQTNLIKDLKQFDFLLQVRFTDEDTKWDAMELMETIRKIDNVLGVFEINIGTIRNADILFFDKSLDSLNVILEEKKEVKMKRIIR